MLDLGMWIGSHSIEILMKIGEFCEIAEKLIKRVKEEGR
jgi:hypothetical protein